MGCKRLNYARTVRSRTFQDAYAQLQSAAAGTNVSNRVANRQAAEFAKARAIAAGVRPTIRNCKKKRKR